LSINNLEQYLRQLSQDNGGDLFGVADITSVRDFVVTQGGKTLEEYPRAVSIGMRILDSIIDQHQPDETKELSLYWHHVYSVVTPALDFLAFRLARVLQAEGYKVFAVPASPPYNTRTWKGVFSHKLAANLAGMGWIGKSCLLITPEYGPRVRFVTLLTDAPLTPGEQIDRLCGKCNQCVKACPVGAFKGIDFRPEDPVEVRFEVSACAEYRSIHPCGKCVAVCPYGKQKKTARS
jgi:epoxyqueuosine reductase QueG